MILHDHMTNVKSIFPFVPHSLTEKQKQVLIHHALLHALYITGYSKNNSLQPKFSRAHCHRLLNVVLLVQTLLKS